MDIKLPWDNIKPSIGHLEDQLAVEIRVIPLDLGIADFDLETFATIIIAPGGGGAVEKILTQPITFGSQQEIR
jgi:hypothetical protein